MCDMLNRSTITASAVCKDSVHSTHLDILGEFFEILGWHPTKRVC